MLPIRLTLQGFIGSRDSVMLDFENAPVWLLRGGAAARNTLCAALCFAFGEGTSTEREDVSAFLHPDSAELRVEFDFRQGEHHFRLRRTLARDGTTTRRAWHWKVGVSPFSGEDGEEEISPSEAARILKAGGGACALLDGLGAEVGEILLDSDDVAKRALLQRALNRSEVGAAFGRLRRCAQTKLDGLEREIAQLETRLAALVADAPVADVGAEGGKDDVEALNAQIEEMRTQRESHERDLAENLRLQVQAREWSELQETRRKVARELQALRLAEIRSGVAEHDALRLEELERVLPVLRQMQELNERRAMSLEASEKARIRLDAWSQQVQSAQQEKALLYWQLQTARESVERYEVARELATHTLVELGPLLHDVDEWERLGAELKLLDAQLATYPVDLDEQVNRVTAEVEAGRELERGWPLLMRLAQARVAWKAAQERGAVLRQEHEREADAVLDVQDQEAEVEARLQDAVRTEQGARAQLVSAEVALETVKARRCQAESASESPCPHCGLSVGAKSLAPSHESLDHAQDAAAQMLEVARRAHEEAEIASIEALKAHTEWQEKLMACRVASRGLKAEMHATEHERDLQARIARETLVELPESFALQVNAVPPKGAAPELTSIFPDPDTLRGLEMRLRVRGLVRQKLEYRLEQRRQRDVLLARRHPAALRWGELAARYSAQSQNIRQKYANAHAEARRAAQALTDLTLQIRFVEQGWDKAEQVWAEARSAVNLAQSLLKAETVTQRKIIITADGLRATLPPGWRALPLASDAPWLREIEAERARLIESVAEARAPERRKAPGALQALEARAASLQAALKGGPPAARRNAQELRVEEVQMRHGIAASAVTLARLEAQRDARGGPQPERAELQSQIEATHRSARLHAELAGAFAGSPPEPSDRTTPMLQAFEARVLAAANRLLNAMGGGGFQAQLIRAQPDSRVWNAFEFEVILSTPRGPSRVLPPHQLEGHARFQVVLALSLALGCWNASRPVGDSKAGVLALVVPDAFLRTDTAGARVIEGLRGLKHEFGRVLVIAAETATDVLLLPTYCLEEHKGVTKAQFEMAS